MREASSLLLHNCRNTLNPPEVASAAAICDSVMNIHTIVIFLLQQYFNNVGSTVVVSDSSRQHRLCGYAIYELEVRASLEPKGHHRVSVVAVLCRRNEY